MTRIQRILDVGSGSTNPRAGLRPITLLGTVAIALGLGIASAAANPQPEVASSAVLSLEGRDSHADYAVVEARILEAVEAQTLRASDAKNVLRALRKSMFGERKSPKRVRLMPPVLDLDSTGKKDLLGRYNEARNHLEQVQADLEATKRSVRFDRSLAEEKRRAIEGEMKRLKAEAEDAKGEWRHTYKDALLDRERLQGQRDIELQLQDMLSAGKATNEEAKTKLEAYQKEWEVKRKALYDEYVKQKGGVQPHVTLRLDPWRQLIQEGKGDQEQVRRRKEELKAKLRKDASNEAEDLTERLRSLESELLRVQEEANRASMELDARNKALRNRKLNPKALDNPFDSGAGAKPRSKRKTKAKREKIREKFLFRDQVVKNEKAKSSDLRDPRVMGIRGENPLKGDR